MYFDLSRLGKFFILLSVIYLISNILFTGYVFAKTQMITLQFLLDSKIFIFLVAGIAMSWNEFKMMNYNLLRMVKNSLIYERQSLPILMIIWVIFSLASISQMGMNEIVYTGFQILTALGIFYSVKN